MLIFEIIKFFIYSIIIVYISKEILVKLLRKIAEMLDLTPKAIGNVAGFATSVPELLTVSFSAIQGLMSAGMYNIISSNVINLIQYISSIIINKNQDKLKNKAVKAEIIMVILTILIPAFLISLKFETSIYIVPIFIFLFFFFYHIRKNAYKLYKMQDVGEKDIRKIEEEKRWLKNKRKKAIYLFLELIVVGVVLFIIGNLLGNTLEVLKMQFNISEAMIGIILGFTTSIPELITFIESQKHYNKNENAIEGVIEATSNLFSSNVINLCIVESIGILLFYVFN